MNAFNKANESIISKMSTVQWVMNVNECLPVLTARVHTHYNVVLQK